MISSTVEEIDQQTFQAKAVQFCLQSEWTNWCQYVQNGFSWHRLLKYPSSLVNFLPQTTFNTLPSPDNLKRWNFVTESMCLLCNKDVCTVSHVLSRCHTGLRQGRYTYGHDLILYDLANIITTFLRSYRYIYKPKRYVLFIRKDQKPQPHKRLVASGIIFQAPDWQILDDLEGRLSVPPFILSSSLRPDLFIFSCTIKTCIFAINTKVLD